MTHLNYSLLFAGLYSYLGLGLTLLISPPDLKRYGLLLAPTVGYCYMTLVGWYCFTSGLRGTDTYATALCLPPLGFLLIALARQMRNRETMRSPFNKDAGIAFALALIAFIAISVPSILSPQGVTATSLGNADIAAYSAAARYLKGFSIGEDLGYLGQAPVAEAAHNRFGTVLATALPSSLFSLEPYQLQNVLMHVFFAFGVLMVYLVGREVFGYKPFAAALGGVLAASNPLLYYTTYHNFESQIIGAALTLALVVLHVQAARIASVRNYLRYLPLTVLMTWGLSVTYGHMLPLVLPAIGVPVLLLAWQRRSHVVVSRWIGFCFVTVLLTLMCSPERGRLVIEQLLFFGGGVYEGEARGWLVPWLLPAGLFIIPNAFPWVGASGSASVAWALGAAFMLLMVWAISSSYRTNRERFSLISAWSVVVLGGYAALAFVDRSTAEWGYAGYKWVSFFLPLILLCLVAPLQTGDGWRLHNTWCALCLALIIVGSAIYSAREVVAMMRTPWVVRPELAALQAIEANPEVDSINILGESGDYWNIMWKAHFLMRKKLYPETKTYWLAEELIGDWDLHSINRQGRFVDDDGILQLRNDGFGARGVINVNLSYTLTRARELRGRYGSGWYVSEETHRWTGNSSAVAQVVLELTTDRKPISLSLTYWPLNPRNQLSVYLNDDFLTNCGDIRSCAVTRIDLKRGTNILEFRSKLPPERPTNGDARSLGYAFGKIAIDPIR